MKGALWADWDGGQRCGQEGAGPSGLSSGEKSGPHTNTKVWVLATVVSLEKVTLLESPSQTGTETKIQVREAYREGIPGSRARGWKGSGTFGVG